MGDKTGRISVTELETDHIVEIHKDKTLDPTTGDFRPNYRGQLQTGAYNMEMTVGEEIIDVKIMIVTGMTVDIEGDKILEVSVMIEVD